MEAKVYYNYPVVMKDTIIAIIHETPKIHSHNNNDPHKGKIRVIMRFYPPALSKRQD